MEHTEKSRFFEQTYIDLVDCHSEIKFTEKLTSFEEDRAEKLINFCRIICEEFKKDERFSDLFSPRSKGTRHIKEVVEELLDKNNGEFQRFTEIDNNF